MVPAGGAGTSNERVILSAPRRAPDDVDVAVGVDKGASSIRRLAVLRQRHVNDVQVVRHVRTHGPTSVRVEESDERASFLSTTAHVSGASATTPSDSDSGRAKPCVLSSQIIRLVPVYPRGAAVRASGTQQKARAALQHQGDASRTSSTHAGWLDHRPVCTSALYTQTWFVVTHTKYPCASDSLDALSLSSIVDDVFSRDTHLTITACGSASLTDARRRPTPSHPTFPRRRRIRPRRNPRASSRRGPRQTKHAAEAVGWWHYRRPGDHPVLSHRYARSKDPTANTSPPGAHAHDVVGWSIVGDAYSVRPNASHTRYLQSSPPDTMTSPRGPVHREHRAVVRLPPYRLAPAGVRGFHVQVFAASRGDGVARGRPRDGVDGVLELLEHRAEHAVPAPRLQRSVLAARRERGSVGVPSEGDARPAVRVRDVPLHATASREDPEASVREGAREHVVAAGGSAAFTRGEPVHVRDVPFEVAHLGFWGRERDVIGGRTTAGEGGNERMCRLGATVGSHLSARVAVYVPSADGLIVAAAVQLVERVPSDACHELFVHVARGRHVETHGAVRLSAGFGSDVDFRKTCCRLHF